MHVFIILFEVLADSNNCINIPQHLFPEKIELLIKLFNIYFLVWEKLYNFAFGLSCLNYSIKLRRVLVQILWDSSRRVEEWDGQLDDSRFFVSAYQVKSLIRYHHDMEKYCTTSTAYFRLPLATSLLCNQRLKSIKSFYRDTIR